MLLQDFTEWSGLDDFISWLEVKDETKEKLNQHFIKFCSKKLKEFAESVS